MSEDYEAAPEGYELIGVTEAVEPGSCTYRTKVVTFTYKKKPTYTEAVKASGWGWPESWPNNYPFIATDPKGEVWAFSEEPCFEDVWEDSNDSMTWVFAGSWCPKDSPPLLGFEAKDTLLKRSDFIS